MQWNDFISKLKKAKTEKRIVGNVAGAFINLIYSGAMDSLTPEGKKPSLETYNIMFEDLRKALNSKANKSKKRKSEMLGLVDVNHNITLGVWRFQNSPITQFNLRKYCTTLLESKGFKFLNKDSKDIRGFMKLSRDLDGEVCRKIMFITDDWQKYFENPDLKELFIENKGYRITEIERNNNIETEKEKFQLIMLGVVVEKTISYTRTGKQRMDIALFTGKEKTGNITFWPERGEAKLDERIISDIKLLNVYAISVNLSEYMGNPGANVASEGVKSGYIKVFDPSTDKISMEGPS